MTVQEQNEIIRKLTACLQQAKKDRDELQEEASRVAGQIQDLQLQLHQVCLSSSLGVLTETATTTLDYECKSTELMM